MNTRGLYFSLLISAILCECLSGAQNPSNRPPNVSIAPLPREVPVHTPLVLSASAEDIDGVIANLTWSQLSGPNSGSSLRKASLSLGDNSRRNATLSIPASALVSAGVYEFKVTAVDNAGATSAATVAITLHHCVINLGSVAPQFNALVFDNFLASHSDVQGRVAVGGDAFFGGSYSVAWKVPEAVPGQAASSGANAMPALVVQGRLQFLSGYVRGAVVHNDSLSIVSLAQRQVRKEGSERLVGWQRQRRHLLQLSTDLASLPTSGSITADAYGGITLTSTHQSVAVFQLSAAQLSGATSLTLHVEATASVVVSVAGSFVTLSNFGMLGDFSAAAARVLFNLPDATAVHMQYIGLQGSLLAPRAHVRFPSGVMHGLLVARSFQGRGQINLPSVADGTVAGYGAEAGRSFFGCGATMSASSGSGATVVLPSEVTTAVEGRVLLASDGQTGVAGAVVTALLRGREFAAVTDATGRYLLRVRSSLAGESESIIVSPSSQIGALSLLNHRFEQSDPIIVPIVAGTTVRDVVFSVTSAASGGPSHPSCNELMPSQLLPTTSMLVLTSFSGAASVAARVLVGGDAVLVSGFSIGGALASASGNSTAHLRVAGALTTQRRGYITGGALFGDVAGSSLDCAFADCSDVSGSGISAASSQQLASWQLPLLSRMAMGVASRLHELASSASQRSGCVNSSSAVLMCGGLVRDLGQRLEFEAGTISGVGSGQPVVLFFTVTAAQLEQASQLVWLPSPSLPYSATVVVNVVGGSRLSLHHMSMAGWERTRGQVVVNAKSVLLIEMSHLQLEASLLAPSAHVVFPSGRVEGQIVVRSMLAGNEVSVAPPLFAGCIPTDSVLFSSLSTVSAPVARAAAVPNANAVLHYDVSVPSVVLNGAVASSASHPRTLRLFSWDKLASSNLAISPQRHALYPGAVVTITGYDVGSYTLRLTVEDSAGALATDTVTLQFHRRCVLDLGPAIQSYAVLTLHSFASQRTVVFGSVAAGADVTLGAVDTVQPAEHSAVPALTAAGRVHSSQSFLDGTVVYGDPLSSAVLPLPGTASLRPSVPFRALPFREMWQRVEAVSTAAAAAPTASPVTSSITTSGGTVTLRGTSPAVNRFHLAAAALSATSLLLLDLPVSSAAVINIMADPGVASLALSNMRLQFTSPGFRHVTLNFPSLTLLSLRHVSLRASLLAPHAAVTVASSDIDGSLVARSVSADGARFHLNSSRPVTPSCGAGAPPSAAAAAAAPSPAAEWVVGDWSACSATCDLAQATRGVVTRDVRCRQLLPGSGYFVHPSRCSSSLAPQPNATQPCAPSACGYRWSVETDWTQCDRQCGSLGQQARTVVCRNALNEAVADTSCLAAGLSSPPLRSRGCNSTACPLAHSFFWSVATATTSAQAATCSATCGGGHFTRHVRCMRRHAGSGLEEQVADGECSQRVAAIGAKPSTRGSCNAQPCVTYAWHVGAWHSNCTAATAACQHSSGRQQRAVHCVSSQAPQGSGGGAVSDALCSNAGLKPATLSACPAMSEAAAAECSTCSAATCDAVYGSCMPDGSCQCVGGYSGDDCTVPPSCSSGVLDGADTCCASGVLSAAGQCCSPPVSLASAVVTGSTAPAASDAADGPVLDSTGRCCGSGVLDACGVCDGNATHVDILGVCCDTSLDAAGLCCTGGSTVDACGVCGGTGTSCGFEADAWLELSPLLFYRRLSASPSTSASPSSSHMVVSAALSLLSNTLAGAVNATSLAVLSIRLTASSSPPSAAASSSSSSSTWAARLQFDLPAQLKPRDSFRPLSLTQRAFGPSLDLLSVTRSAVCGNGVCELGEAVCPSSATPPFAAAATTAPACCPEDCAFTRKTCPVSSAAASPCGGAVAGRCIAASGQCVCNTASGYTGAACDSCLPGWIPSPANSSGRFKCVRHMPSPRLTAQPSPPVAGGGGTGAADSDLKQPQQHQQQHVSALPLWLLLLLSACVVLGLGVAAIKMLPRCCQRAADAPSDTSTTPAAASTSSSSWKDVVLKASARNQDMEMGSDGERTPLSASAVTL